MDQGAVYVRAAEGLRWMARLNLQMLAIGRNLNQLARAGIAGVSITWRR
jgi:hypothetical protein